MKQFLYLDTDIVNSIIAQAEQGLVEGLTVEVKNETTRTDSSTKEVDAKANIGGSFLKLMNAEGEIRAACNKSGETGRITATNEIVAKVMHDASFDFAIKCITPIKTIDEKLIPGNYIKVSRSFSFVDFGYIGSLFDDDNLLDLIVESDKAEAEKAVEEIEAEHNRQEKRTSKFNKDKEVKKLLDENRKSHSETGRLIKAIRTIAPYERMLISSDGLLIPLEDKYFRINPNSLGFRYGGQITCVGMVTNTITGRDENAGDMFSAIQDSVNSIFRTLIPGNSEQMHVVHPIAIYYDDDL